MRIVVLGTGGVGGYFGARLARGGAEVTFVARGAHLEAIQKHGLRIRSVAEGEYIVQATATERVAAGPPADAVLLCVKAFDTERALHDVAPVVGPETAVLTLQNGVASAETIDAVLGPRHAVGGVAYVFAVIEAPGVIAHRFAGRVVLGELDGRPSPRTERLHEAFTRAGVPVELSTHIQRVLWEKYLFITAQAGLTAATRCQIGAIRAVPETWRLYRLVLEELAAVARAAGVALPADIVDGVMAMAGSLGPETSSSLAHDLAQGRRLELEALQGHAVRLGERLGVPTPSTFALYAALKPHADGRRS